MCPNTGISKIVPASKKPIYRYIIIVAIMKARNEVVKRLENEEKFPARSTTNVAIKRAV